GGLAPDGLGLGLDAFLAVEDGDGAVEHAHGAFDLGGEVHVTRGVDQVDRVALAEAVPGAGGGGGVDRDAALLLLGVEVHDGGAFVDLAHLVDLAGVIEDPLGDGGLAGVDVGGDADVANLGQVPCHIVPFHTVTFTFSVSDAPARRAPRPGQPTRNPRRLLRGNRR